MMRSAGAVPGAPTSGPSSGLSVAGGSSAGAATSSTSTTGPSSHSTLGDGDINYSKGYKAIQEICRQVMTTAFEAHFLGGSQPIKDWLAQKGWSNRELKKRRFKKEQLAAIDAGTDFPDMDISLKYNVLQHFCNFSIKPEEWHVDHNSEEYSLYALKEKRNEFAHEADKLKSQLKKPNGVKDLFDELRDLSFRALGKLEGYLIDNGQPVADVDRCRRDLQALLDGLKTQDIPVEVSSVQEKLRRDGRTEVENQLEHLLDFEPFPSIFGLGRFKLQEIYKDLDLYTEKRGLNPKDTQKIPLPVENLLTTPLDGSNDMPHVICIEGSSSAGKSTLLAHAVSDRLDTAGTIAGLKAVDLVLHLNCNQKNSKTFLDLLKSSLPRTTKDIGDDVLLRAARNLRLLVLIDGLDEVSEDGRTLLQDLFQEARNTRLRVMLTTRTSSLDEAQSLMGGLKWLRVTLPSLSKAKVENMARGYFGALSTKMTDPPPPPEDQVVRDVCTAAEHLEPTPRNVLLLTYLALVDPEKVKAPLTLPELHKAFDEILWKMLRQRLLGKGLSLPDIQREIRTFTRGINAAALECLLKRETDIRKDDLDEIASKCTCQKDMLDTLFIIRRARSVTGDQTFYAFPHQSQLEYRAALGVCDRLERNKATGQQGGETDLCFILGLKSLEWGKRKEQLARLWNFLLILVGTLRLQNLLSRHADEMAQLVVSSCKKKHDEALEAIGQARMDQAFTTAVASKLSPRWVVTKHFHVLSELRNLPSRVDIVFWRCCKEVPHLAEALDNLRRRKDVEVNLLVYGCMRPAPCFRGCCTWPIRRLTAPGGLCTVVALTCPWDPDALIPASVRLIALAIRSPEDLEGLKGQLNQLPRMLGLELHVCAAAGYEARGPPLEGQVVFLHLYGVSTSDWGWTIGLFASLLNSRKYEVIVLRASDLTPADTRRMIREWAEAGVRMNLLELYSAYSWQTWKKDCKDLRSLVEQELAAVFKVRVAPTRAEQTGTTAGQDPPADQKLQVLPLTPAFGGPLPRVWKGVGKGPVVVHLPGGLSFPYSLRLKLRATRCSVCFVYYLATVDLAIIDFTHDSIRMKIPGDASTSVAIQPAGLEIDRVHLVELEEWEDRVELHLDGKSLGAHPKRSEDVTLRGKIYIDGKGLELISVEVCSRSRDPGHPASTA